MRPDYAEPRTYLVELRKQSGEHYGNTVIRSVRVRAHSYQQALKVVEGVLPAMKPSSPYEFLRAVNATSEE